MGTPDFYLRRIGQMLDDRKGGYDFARQTLEGIRDKIIETNKVTGRQRIAIMNIKRSVQDNINQ